MINLNTSVVNIVFAVEVVGVLLFVIDAFHLNRSVEKTVLASAEVCYGREGLQRFA